MSVLFRPVLVLSIRVISHRALYWALGKSMALRDLRVRSYVQPNANAKRMTTIH